MMTLADIKNALRNGPYAWPGGYPTFFITSHGEALSHAAVRADWVNVCAEYISGGNTGWRIAAIDINWEDPDLYCAETNARIPSAYAEPD